VLTEEGFVDGYEVSGEALDAVLTVTLQGRGAHADARFPVLRRISRPGLRVYARKSRFLGFSAALASRSSRPRGIDDRARCAAGRIGGEVVAFVWCSF